MSRARRALRPDAVRRGAGAAGLCLVAAANAASALAETADAAPDGATRVQDVVVTARKPQVVALSKTIQETPQVINVLPKELLETQGVASLQQALKNVPGVTLNAGEGGSHGDSINLRGFAASDDFFLDGLRDTGFYTRDPFNLQGIEVYKGPASTLFGRGSTGGVIDQVSKTPRLDPLATVSVTGGTKDARITGDFDTPIGSNAAFRITGMDQDAGVEGRAYVRNRRWGFAPSLTLGVGGPDTLTVSLYHEGEDNTPDYGIPFLGSRPAPVSHSAYYGLVRDDAQKTNVNIGTARYTHVFSDALTFTDLLRYGHYYFDTRQTAPHWGATPPLASMPLDTIVVFRDRPSESGLIETTMNVSELTWKSQIGSNIAQTLTGGVEFDRESASLVRFANQMSAIAPTPLLDPDPFEAFPGHQTTVSSRPVTRTDTVSGFLIDTVDFGSHWTLTAALRYDQFAAHYNEPISHAHFDHTDNIASPRTSLVYKATQDLDFYIAYGTSYDPSAENLSLSARTADLAPEKDRTFEAGVKAMTLGEKLALGASVFNTEMTNARVGDPTNPSLQILAGDLRVNGVELNAQGYIAPGWEIIAGYTYLDAKTIKSSDPSQVGQRVANTAPNQANLWLTWEPDEDRWKLGAGLNYLDKRAADVAGVATIPGYVTLDAMASYKLSRHLTLQLNAFNLTDKFYFTNAYYSSPVENHVLPGAGRTLLLTAVMTY
ncbi:MAG TPA: TonB-dependent siderophore receptor [Caulobacteraceae bacterium]|jgi:catecholate siderophore receptor